ncbi:MAG: membrane integrity-associated transporter subunit PqiC [Opitutales bacterium]|nr:membrane integrity-associated transporter subunit PqiC [Opitutales bacterium]
MKSRILLGLLATASLLAIPACVSLEPQADTTRWFMLDQFSVTSAYEGTFESSSQLHISRPHIPEYLNSQRIFFRSADGSPQTTQQERWAEPFSDGLARTLALRLSARSGIGNVSYYPIPRPAEPSARVQVQVFQFEAIQDKGVVLDMSWRVESDQERGKTHRFRRTVERERFENIEAMVQAMSEALDEAVEEITEAVNDAVVQN